MPIIKVVNIINATLIRISGKSTKQMYKKNTKQVQKAHPVDDNSIPHTLNAKLFSNKQLWIFIILTLTVISYIPVFTNTFIDFWDDGIYITKNNFIKELNLKIIFSAVYSGNYHPFVTLFNAIEYHFFKYNPVVYHFDNLLFHLFNTVLVFKFVEKFIRKNEVAVITALFFGIHPMHVESVAWASERKDVLYTFFYLLALINYIKYISFNKNNNKYYIYTLILFICSLFSKSAAVSFPLLLLLIDWFNKRNFNFYCFLEKIPFFIVALIFGFIAIHSQKGAISSDYIDLHYTYFERIFLTCYAICLYLYKMFIPLNLTIMYPYPDRIKTILPIVYYLAPIAIIIIAFIAYRSINKSRYIAFGLIFFLITIALVLQVLPVGCFMIAERYSYVPYIGTYIIIGTIFSSVFRNTKKNAYQFKLIFMTIILGYVLSFVSISYIRAQDWNNEEKLLIDAAEKNPSLITFYYVGNSFYLKKDFEKANKYYSKCLNLDSNFDDLNKIRGIVNFNLQKFEDAKKDFDKALKLKPNDTSCYINRGNTLCKLNKFQEAISDYTLYLNLKPEAGDAYLFRGVAFYNLNNFNDALKDFNKSILLNQKDTQSYLMRGILYCQTGKLPEAVNDLDNAEKLNSTNFKIYCYRAWAYYAMKDKNRLNIKKAISDYSKALKIIPDDQSCLVYRAIAYKDLGMFDLAIKDAEKAKSLGYSLDLNFFRQNK